jgi:hypothetical protein
MFFNLLFCGNINLLASATSSALKLCLLYALMLMAETTKARQASFIEFINSEKMFIQKFNELKSLKLIP